MSATITTSDAPVFGPPMTAQEAELANLRKLAGKAREQLAFFAKQDVETFLEYAIRDERTGKPIHQGPAHHLWHQLAEQHARLVLWSHVEAGKTTQLSIGRTLWLLGRNPNARVCVVSNTHGQAEKLTRTIARYIEQSAPLRHVFPSLAPDKNNPWTSTQLFVKRGTVSKDPSVQSIGIHGNITGARIDYLILDDVLDYENTRTPRARQELVDWYNSTLPGRLSDGARVLVVGTAYHPDDLLHRLGAAPGWKAVRFPVLDPDTKLPTWPERWSLARIEARRSELSLTPMEFARQMLCEARDDSESRFKREWIDKCLARGRGLPYTEGLSDLPQDYRVYTGVDLAASRRGTADLTVLFTILVHPDQTREVLEVQAGRWSAAEIIARSRDVHERYGSILVVENNAAQDYIVQFTADVGVPVVPFTTGRNKAHPEFGLESLAAELAQGKWIIPNEGGCPPKEVNEWVREMLYYSPDAHTGDRLMASWLAREGARLGNRTKRPARVGVTVVSPP